MNYTVLRLIAASLLVGLIHASAATSSKIEPVYLSQPWFHPSSNVNVFTTPDNVRVAVDNEGRHLADSSINSKNNRFNQLALESLRSCDGEYFAAVQRDAYEGSISFTYYRISQDGKILDANAMVNRVDANPPAMPTAGFSFDADARYGMPGFLLFPKVGMAVFAARSNVSVHPFGAAAAPVAFGAKDSVAMQFEVPSASGKPDKFQPTGVMADPNGEDFWTIASAGGKLAAIHAKPGLKPDGGRSLNLGKIIPVGDATTESFESGVAADDALYLLLARADSSIGGVDAKRRLVRVGLADGKVTETTISFQHYIKEAALALCGKRIIAHAWRQVVALDRDTFAPQWDREIAELSDRSPLDYRIYRITVNPQGTHVAVALATEYRRPNEPTRVLLLDPAGTVQQSWALKPGSIDNMEFTSDGGLLVFSSNFTAKLGGSAPMLVNETASIAQATAPVDPSRKSTVQEAVKPAFLTKPLLDRHKVWFGEPGGSFHPLGNGILAAMMYGDTDTARTILDLDSSWDGSDRNQGTFQSLGEINFRFGHDPKTATNFRRELDLRTGLFTMTYQSGGVTYKREAFCSYPRGLLGIRFSADKPGAISGQLELTARQKAVFTKTKDGIAFSGQKTNGQKFACALRIHAQGGKVQPESGKDGTHEKSSKNSPSGEDYQSVLLQDCDSVTLYVAGDTDYAMDPAKQFKGVDPQQKIAPRLANIGKLDFEAMKQESMADVSKLFDRCTLDLATHIPEAEALPVNKRRESYKRQLHENKALDLGFQALAFDAARYMMIACSRPGALPANLQGHWNEGNSAAWTGDYHTDINVEMNYWFVEPANLAECAIPLFDYIESQIPYWRKKAKSVFGEKVRGWTVDYTNNIFGGGAYMNYPPGSAWLSWHYATHFEFSQDMGFLDKRAYPLMKELSEHWEDLLIQRPDGALTTPKTSSPEHGPFQFGIAQDRQMVSELLTNYQAAATRLKRDGAFSKQVENLRSRITPVKIGRWGQVQEWEADEDSRYDRHRHMMHLFAAFPGREINPTETPELNAAAIKSLEARGDGGTGWTKAWRASLYARMQRPDLAYRALSNVVSTFHDNLIWEGREQIDAPCGFASGVCEMLLQSHLPLDQSASRFEIHLLPALPSQWPSGSVKGLRARGGYELDIEWQDGALTKAEVRGISNTSGEVVIRYAGRKARLQLARAASQTVTTAAFR